MISKSAFRQQAFLTDAKLNGYDASDFIIYVKWFYFSGIIPGEISHNSSYLSQHI